MDRPQPLTDKFRRSRIEKPFFFVMCLVIVGILLVFYVRWTGTAAIDPLRAVQVSQIDKIELYDSDFRQVVRVVDERQAIQEFAKACRDVEYYAPGSSTTTTNHLNLTIQGNSRIELHCWYDERIPHYVIGYIVQNTFPPNGGRHQSIKARFKSKSLGSWLDTNLLQ